MFLDCKCEIDDLLMFNSSIDDDYLQNASAILEKLKFYYREGGETGNLSKELQDYTQVPHYIKLYLICRAAINA